MVSVFMLDIHLPRMILLTWVVSLPFNQCICGYGFQCEEFRTEDESGTAMQWTMGLVS
jgi:hypothetical protein